QEISEAFKYLKLRIPLEADELVKWFEETYVLGKVHSKIGSNHIGWHLCWATLVSNKHVRAYAIIEEIQKEQQMLRPKMNDFEYCDLEMLGFCLSQNFDMAVIYLSQDYMC
ncbi:5371_t:CDS:2, partial [Dentiscutata heterogama]